MAHALLRLAAQRFVLSRQGSRCLVKGNITGDMNYEKYRDLFEGSEVVSLEGVPFASWVGLERFLAAVLSFNPGKRVVLDNVSWNLLYSACCLLKEEPRLAMDRVELLVHEATAAHPNRKWVLVEHLLERMRLGQETPTTFASQTQVLAVLEILFGKTADIRGIPLHDDIRQRLEDPACFALLVIGFHHCVLELSRVHLESIAVSALQVVQGLVLQLDSALKAIAPLGLGPLPTLPPNDKLLDDVAALFEPFFESLAEVLAALNRALLAAQKAATAATQTTGNARDDINEPLARARELMEGFCARADAFGVQVFEKVMLLAVGEPLKAAVLTLEGTPTTNDRTSLEKLAEAFFVVDVFAAESWDTLKPAILAECDAIDAAVMNLTIELQGFDAVRQVIEKRAKEIGVWLDMASKPAMDRREAVLAATSHKLVTQQERKAFALYFSDLMVFDGSSVDTTDINFF